MIVHDLIESFLRGIDGGLGRFLRYHYYRRRLASCGQGVVIDAGVHLVNPKSMHIGDNVWIDRNVVIIAGKVKTHTERDRFIQITDEVAEGEVRIGKQSHIGIGTIIQGHGGVYLSQYCTTSAGCKIYSYSNDVSQSQKGTMQDSSYIIHPVFIGFNTWLGLNAIVLGHRIGDNSFVKPNTVVTCDVPDNCIYGNDGSKKRFEQVRT
jgi:galactoside O-acetyltransferase